MRLLKLHQEIKLRINKPSHDVKGPGNIGMKLPIMPKIISTVEIIISKRSIDIIR